MKLQPYEYAEDFTVYGYDGDYRGDIKPGSVLRYAQEVAGAQCTHYGITDEVYARTHTAYVLAKIAIHFSRVPKINERLTLITQPEKLKRAANKRLTVVLDENGAETALVDSRWVLIDIDKRMILRKHPPEICGPWAEEIERSLPMRMKKPELADTENLGERRAEYSRCDTNGHLNNTRYLDIVFDALPLDVLDGAEPLDILVLYHKEVPLGESFTLHRRHMEDDSWYFCGMREDKACFEASVTLKPRG